MGLPITYMLERHPRLKKGLIIGGFILASLIVLLIAAPMFIDGDDIAEKLKQSVAESTGRTVQYGSVSVSLFPSTSISLHDVTIANAPKATANNFLRISKLTIHGSIFGDNTQSGSIELYNPVLELEELNDGTDNWKSVVQGKTDGLPSLDEVRIHDGQIIYTNHTKNFTETLQNVDARVTLGAQNLNAEYSMMLKDEQTKGTTKCTQMAIQQLNQFQGQCSSSMETVGKGAVRFEGAVQSSAQGLASRGKWNIDHSDVRPWLDFIFGGGQGRFAKYFDQPVPLSLAMDAYVVPGQMVANISKLESGKSIGNGRIESKGDTLDIQLAFSQLDYDTLIGNAIQAHSGRENDLFASMNSLPSSLTGTWQLSAQRAIYKQTTLRDVQFESTVQNGELRITQLEGQWGKTGRFVLKGALKNTPSGLQLNAQTDMTGEQMHNALPLFNIPQSAATPDTLGQFRTRFNLISRGESLTISSLRLIVGQTKVSGGINVFLNRKIPHVEASLSVAEANLTDFAQHWLQGATLWNPRDARNSNPFTFRFLQQLPATFSIGLTPRNSQFYSLPIRQGSIRLNVEPNKLSLSNASLSLNDGNTIAGNLVIQLGEEKPRINGDLSIDALSLGEHVSATLKAPQAQQTGANNQWSNKTLNFTPLSLANGEIKWNIGTLDLGFAQLQNVQTKAVLDNQSLQLQALSAQLWEGNLQGMASFSTEVVPQWEAELSLSSAEADAFWQSFTPHKNFNGALGLSARLNSNGNHVQSMAENLSGAISFGFRNLTVSDFNVPAATRTVSLAKDSAALSKNVRQVLARGLTRFAAVDGTLFARQGKLVTENTTLQSDATTGRMNGQLTLSDASINSRLQLALPLPNAGNQNTLGIGFTGPLSKPGMQLYTSAIEAYVAAK